MEESLNLAKNGIESAFYGNIYKQFENLIKYFISIRPSIKALEIIQKQLNEMFKEKIKIKKIYEAFPELLNDSLKFIYFCANNFERNKSKNKSLLNNWRTEFTELYKNKNKEFSKLITKENLQTYIDESIKNYYEKQYNEEKSKIKDFESLSLSEKNECEKKIKELLEPKSDELKKIFELVVNNYV